MQHFSEIEKEIETSMLMFLEMPVHWIQPTIVLFIATTTNEVNWGQHNSQNVLIGYQRYVHNFQFLKINLESPLKTNLSCSVIA